MKKLLRFIFSGYFLSGLMILAEIGALFMLVVRLSYFSAIFFIIVTLVDALSLLAVINMEGSPERRLTWMAVILLLPILGTLLFLLFRTRGMSKRDVKRSERIMEEMDRWRYPESNLSVLESESREAYCRARAILESSPTSGLYRNTESQFFSSGEQMYSSMLADLAVAEKYILLEYFILEDGVMWRGIEEILKKKTSEGCTVRLLVDDIGCMGKLDSSLLRDLEKSGIATLRFNRFTPRFSAKHNNRDHRKLLIVDGVIGYTGGINIADEYINERERFGHWRDGGIRLYGEGVSELVRLYLSMWDMTSGALSEYSFFLDNLPKTVPVSNNCGYVLPFGCGPEPLYRGECGKRALLDIIEMALTYVYITTPYLIIDNDLSVALEGAALRGVDVRIITPGVPDKRLVKLMGRSFYLSLIRAGVKIYEYTPGFIHEKTIVSDDSYAIIGTINLDYRSLVHHYEDAVLLFGSKTVMSIKESFIGLFDSSLLIDEKRASLGVFERLFTSIARLFAPLL
ncbi:MAG: PLDc N-terminal domain-containing protein [Clostridia bacterium]|nr:PLDc N-terminal domain-containing protein [Clostridia bacterium]